jgi:two-component system, NarL family, invasion response regulator UvrY
MIKMLVCEDHELVRDGIRLVASETSDIEVADEASTGVEAYEKAVNGSFDVVLLDLSLPDKNGLDVLKDLMAQRPDSRVLVVSMYSERQYAVRVLKAGALGYVAKGEPSRVLTEAIRAVASGNRYITPAVGLELSEEFLTGSRGRAQGSLSDREYQVMCMIGDGNPPREIAKLLKISANSVKTYRSRIMTKMDFRSNADIVRYVSGL